MRKNFWNRALWPLLGLGLLGVVALQARASVFPSRRAKTSPSHAASSAAPAESAVAAEGRVAAYPGAQVVVGTDLAGTLVTLSVDEKDRVHRGQVIAELRADDYRASLAEARAHVDEADADIRLAKAEVERARALWEKEVGSKQAVDRAERDVEAAKARRATAAATVDRLQAVLAKTRIVAPIDGTVIARHAQRGETLDAGKPIVTIADLARTRVEAELDEFDAGRVRLGDEARVTAEGFNGSWRGRVEEIPDSVVGRRLKPQDPGKPEDTRVLLVKVALLEPSPLKLGQRVEIRIAAAPQAAP